MLFAVKLCVLSQKFISPYRGNFHSVKGGSLRTVGGWGGGLSGGGDIMHAHTCTTNNPHVLKRIVCLCSSKKNCPELSLLTRSSAHYKKLQDCCCGHRRNPGPDMTAEAKLAAVNLRKASGRQQ